MLQPVRTKWRKAHKGRIHGHATRASTINYGAYALKALQPERVTGKQIEAARVALTRHMKRQGSCLLYTSPSPRDMTGSRMPSSA